MTHTQHVKDCFKCGKTLPLGAFYKHKGTADGRLNKCKECAKTDAKQYRMANLEKVREYDRKRGFRGSKHREARNKAHSIKVKNECVHCFSKSNIEKHHPDYTNPSFVVPLCRDCHRRLHSILNIEDLSIYL